MTRKMLRSLSILLASASLAGCAAQLTEGATDDARTVADRFAPKVEEKPEEIRLALHAQGLSPAQTGAIATFSDGWRDTGGREIKIQAPNTRDTATAYRMSEAVRQALVAQGVPESRIVVAGYDAAGDDSAPLIVGYLRYSAEIPKCGKDWPNIAHSNSNKAQPNFGCAVTSNMTAQIADPGDLVAPRAMTPSDAARRQSVLDKYRSGEKTGAEKDEAASGAVSSAVK